MEASSTPRDYRHTHRQSEIIPITRLRRQSTPNKLLAIGYRLLKCYNIKDKGRRYKRYIGIDTVATINVKSYEQTQPSHSLKYAK